MSRAVSHQDADPDSTLNTYRRLLHWRRTHPALARGALELSHASDTLLAYVRTLGADVVLCVFNLGDEAVRTPLPEGSWTVLDGMGFASEIDGAEAVLPPFQALFAARS